MDTTESMDTLIDVLKAKIRGEKDASIRAHIRRVLKSVRNDHKKKS